MWLFLRDGVAKFSRYTGWLGISQRLVCTSPGVRISTGEFSTYVCACKLREKFHGKRGVRVNVQMVGTRESRPCFCIDEKCLRVVAGSVRVLKKAQGREIVAKGCPFVLGQTNENLREVTCDFML